MADPTRGQLQIEGQDKLFYNSGDQRLILTGQVPEIKFGNPLPDTRNLAISSEAPQVGKSSSILVGTDKLQTYGYHADGGPYVTGEQPVGGWGVGMLLRGQEVTIAGNLTIQIDPDALTISEQTPARKTGLKLESDAPTVGETRKANPDTRALSFSSEGPDVFAQPPIRKVPPKKAVVLTGQAPGIKSDLDAGNPDSLSFGSAAPTRVFEAKPVPNGSLVLIGQLIDDAVVSKGSPPTIIIRPGANRGTPIENPNAVTGLGTRSEVCAISGRKVKPGMLVQQWDGLWVHPDHYTARHPMSLPQERKAESLEGSPRPEHEDKFIGEDVPEVTVDDL